MPPPMPNLWIESIYSFIVIVSCMLIYFRTKELYELTSHRGIKYFRNTFLFFGITYAVRFIGFLAHPDGMYRANPIYFDAAFFLVAYSSSMALIYLISSIFWKRLDPLSKKKEYIFHAIASTVALLSVLIGMKFLIFAFQGILFLLLMIVSYINYKKTKNKGPLSKIYILYLLIFGLWITSNVLELVAFFSEILAAMIYGASILLFVLVLLRVLKELNPRN